MIVVRRILAILVMVVSVVVLLVCLGGGIGVWVVKDRVTAETTRLLDRAEAALNVAGRALGDADASLTRAADSVQAMKDGHARLVGGAAQDRPALGLIAMSINNGLLPQVRDARGRLQAAAEVAVALQGLLGGIDQLPLVSVTRPDAERLRQAGDDLTRVAGSAETLRGMLTDAGPGEGPAPAAVGSRVDNIQRLLQEVRARIEEYERKVAGAQQEVGVVRSRALAWIGPGTLIVSLVLFWIALSQISMLAHARSWLWRGRA